MSQKAEGSFVSFILIGVATITTIYWVRVIKKMLKNVKPKYTAREAEAKNWVYDLIKGENQFVFVSEVPGPDDKIIELTELNGSKELNKYKTVSLVQY